MVDETQSMAGKTVLVTGASGGIDKATAMGLARSSDVDLPGGFAEGGWRHGHLLL